MDYDQFEYKAVVTKKGDHGIKTNKLDSILIKKRTVIFACNNANVNIQNKIRISTLALC